MERLRQADTTTNQTSQLAVAEDAKWGIMDALDEELIRADLAGTEVDDLVYSFKTGDKLIEDLTSQGAIAMARLAVQTMPVSILCDKPVTEERPKSWKASTKCAYVTERGNRFEFWGTFVQSKDIFNKEGEFIRTDPKAEQIAEVKSTRNVILKIFPKTARVGFIKQFKSEGKIKEISPEQVNDAAAKAKVVGRTPATTAKSSTQTAPKSTGRKVIKYFQNSKKQQVKIPASHPLYGEFVDWCAKWKADHLDVEYKIKRDDESLDGDAVSVTWENLPAGSELEKTIDEMMMSIADGVS